MNEKGAGQNQRPTSTAMVTNQEASLVTTNTKPKASPVSLGERVVFVDILRGFALIGVLTANMFSFSGQSYLPADLAGLDRILVATIRFLVEAKFYSMFSLLFGWGMAVQMLRADARGTRFVPTFLRRLTTLLAIGIVHSFFLWTGDILTTYAMYGYLLLAIRKMPSKIIPILVIVALIIPIVLSAPGDALDSFREWYQNLTEFMRLGNLDDRLYADGSYLEITRLRIQETLSGESYFIYTFGNIFSMFMLGLYIGKRRIFHDIKEHLTLVRRVLPIALAIGVVFNGIYIYALLNPDVVEVQYYRLLTRGARTIGAPALMLFYISSLILLLQKPNWQERLAPLGNVGRMALTNYLTHSVINTLLFYGYGAGLYGMFGPVFGLAWTAALYIGQVRFSAWWLEGHRYGPMEWLWRVLTYGRAGVKSSARDSGELDKPAVRRPAIIWMRSHTGLIAVWVILLLWAGALGYWWTELPEAEQSREVAVRAAARARATASAGSAEATPRAGAMVTPVAQPLQRAPGEEVQAGNLWSVAMAFDAEKALAELSLLSSPEYDGRRAGTEGGWAAADHIAHMFEAYDLRPAGDDGSYFQEFPLDYYIELTEHPTLQITDSSGASIDDYLFREDFTNYVGYYGGDGQAEGKVIWLNTCSHDDFDDMDAVGAVALCREGSSEDILRNGLEHGIAGLLLWRGSEEYSFDRLGRYRESWVPQSYPSFAVSSEVVSDLLQGTTLTLADLTIQFESVELSTRASLSVALHEREGALGRNVLGVIPGADPQHADELIIVGGHYDHMGRDPSWESCPGPGESGDCQTIPGLVWPGANDNASGIATMIEVARSWQEAGYVPDRTVLFGAWDAEEQGLWGSIHYVMEPQYPLTQTVAMIQLDMVAGERDTLVIDGSGHLADKLQGMAASVGIASTTDDYGHSDHVPFREAGVPASALSWDNDNETYYHRPVDTPDTISAEELEAAGELTSLALLSLASVEPEIGDLVAARGAAINSGDMDRFLVTSTRDQRAQDTGWWHDALEMQVEDVRLGLSDVITDRDVVTATLSMRYDYGEQGIPQSLRSDVLFRRANGEWLYGGPALEEMDSEHLIVAYAPDQRARAQSLLESAEDIYPWALAQVGQGVGTSPGRLEVYESADDLRVTLSPGLSLSTRTLVDGVVGRVVSTGNLTTSQAFTTTLVQMALGQTQMKEDQAPWLWGGFPLLLEAEADPIDFQHVHLPRLQRILEDDLAAPIGSMPLRREIQSSSDADTWEAQAWAMAGYLVRQYGPDAPGQLAQALGSGLSLDDALTQHFSQSSDQFDSAWKASWHDSLSGAQEGLAALLSQRQEAVVNGDRAGFLDTVHPNDPTLLLEQGNWFDEISAHSLADFTLEGQLLALTDGGALAQYQQSVRLDGSGEQRVSYRVGLKSGVDQWYFAGQPMLSASTEHFVVRHTVGLTYLADDLMPVLDSLYAQVTSDLGIAPETKTEIKLYDSPAAFRSSISPSIPASVSRWAMPGASIKLLLTGRQNVDHVSAQLAHSFAQQLSAGAGLQVEWLREGIAQLAQATISPQTGYLAARRITRVQKAAKQDQLPDLSEIPSLEDVPESEFDLIAGSVRDAVEYLVLSHGRSDLNALVRSLSGGTEFEAAFLETVGIPFSEFQIAWRESAARGHVPVQWVEDANRFDAEGAIAHAQVLSSPALDGREAGSAGAEAAAQYVADQFAQLGMQPAGDQGSYFQSLPFTRTVPTDLPSLVLAAEGGEQLTEFVYEHDFREIMIGAAGGGSVSGPLVWIRDGEYSDMDLSGKIAVRRVSYRNEQEVRLALEHGAGGLLLVTDLREADMQMRTLSAQSVVYTETIPALELTVSSFERLIKEAGHTMAELNGSPPALVLRLTGEMMVPLNPAQPFRTSNVLGLIPGSDPGLAEELVILSAHYDHVGRSPDGTLYPGADDDASGVGLLLEVARCWQEAGARPSRSVLFAAWGAEEYGQLGSRFYVDHPLVPLESTRAVIHVDRVGAGRGFYLTLESDVTREALLRLHLESSANLVEGRMDFVAIEDESDHTPFQDQDVPAGLLTWAGSDDDANNPSDTIDRLDPLKLGKTGRIVTLALRTLAE